MFQLLLAPVHKVRYLLFGASQHLCGLPVAQFFKIDQKKCLPVFLFELAQCGVQLLVLFVLKQPGFGQCLVRQFKRQFLQRQKKPPPGLAAQCEIAPGFIEVSLEAAILNGPLSCKNMGKGLDHQILCLVDIAQHAVDVKGQRVAIPLYQQLSGSFVSGQILPVGCFV